MQSSRLTEQEIYALERPISDLMVYYAMLSALLGPFFFLVLIPLSIRYFTLRYRFDEEGVSMRWGIFFRREINLTYARIQDIHLMSNVVERWLGLARIKIQTASGSSEAEMTIEGIAASSQLRDFLYDRMRGTRTDAGVGGKASVTSSEGMLSHRTAVELTRTLQAVTAEVRELRLALGRQSPASPTEGEGRGSTDA